MSLFTVSPLINGQKPDFFSRASRAILSVGFYFFEISTDCFSRGTIFLKSLSNLCPRGYEEGGFKDNWMVHKPDERCFSLNLLLHLQLKANQCARLCFLIFIQSLATGFCRGLKATE